MIRQKIGVRIALMVNLFLLLIMVGGAVVLFNQQVQQYEKQLLDKGKLAATLGAKAVGQILEEAIDNGALTLSDALDTQYQEIPGFDPPKYHTRYDAYLDKAILLLQDELLKFANIQYAVAQDVNGYLPTHNTRYNQPITGDPAKDLVGNRTKRIFSDDVGLKVGKNETPGLVQVYHRDTGQRIWDISSPIYVKGKHWGGFRIGFELEDVLAAQKKLVLSLAAVMGTILVCSMILTFILINNALKPLAEFTRIASELADGNVDQPVVSTSGDEIGRLADVLERLRVSLKAAMERLSRR